MFDRTILRALRTEMEAALQSIAKKHGISIDVGSASFTPANATFKVQLATIGKDGEVNTKEADNFKRYAVLFGLKPEDFGREFKTGRDTYKITGLAPRRQKFPIQAERSDGKSFKFPVETVKALLAVG